MIILITGQPGSGKTALCVDMLAFDEQFKGRPLFVGGVPGLTIDHQPVPPVAEWTEIRNSPEDESIKLAYFTFPASSVVVVDEAQRIYRPRSASSKVPPEVAAFETHRHTGVDFILLTQHPGLLDSNIRKLVGKHIHIAVTPMGRRKYEWTKCVDPESKTERDIAASDRYILPKRAFELYKSSELHTKIKVKMPFYVYLLVICVVLALGLIYYMYGRITSKIAPDAVQNINNPVESSGGGEKKVLTLAEYHAQAVPRVPGLHHTAPKYDEITKPKDAPWPAGCFIQHGKKDNCRCIDQQGNNYATTPAVCLGIVQNGMFKDFGADKQERNDSPESKKPMLTAKVDSQPIAPANPL